METIQVQALTEESFRPFGAYMDLTDDKALAAKSVFPAQFFADVIPLYFGGVLPPTVSVNQLKRQDTMTVNFIEFHHKTCEGILPLDSDVIMYVGLPEMSKLSTKRMKAFRVPKHTFVRLDPLIIHGSLFCTEETGHALCLLPGRTFANDFEAKLLGSEDAVKIEL